MSVFGLAWMATSLGSFFSPVFEMPTQPVSAAVGSASTPIAVFPALVERDKTARCENGVLIEGSCQVTSPRQGLVSWRNMQLLSPRLLGRSSSSAPEPTPAEVKPTPTPRVVTPPVKVRTVNAPASGEEQVFKQCLALPQPRSKEAASEKAAAKPAFAPAPKVAAETLYQVVVKNKVVMELPSQSEAARIAQRLTKAINAPGFSPSRLRLVLVEGKPSVSLDDATLTSNGDRILFSVDRSISSSLRRTADLIAIDWFNNLRAALNTEPLSLMEAQADLYSLNDTKRILGGITSWYGPGFHNRRTANGERFNQYALTAAHPKLPFNTYLRVTNPRNGASVIVRINDRGPYVGRRSLDLSRQAARCIGSEKPGVVRYEAVILEPQTTVQ